MLPPRALFAIAVAAFVSGVVLGVAARLVMRFIALEAGLPGSFSLEGSIEVAAFGAIVGTPVAFCFILLRSRIRLDTPWPGTICGLLLFLILALVPPPSARSALKETPDTPAATALAFALLFIGWGAGLDYFSRRTTGEK